MLYYAWCALSTQELALRDIAEVNLASAVGLPGTEALDVRGLCRQVDEWSAVVRDATGRFAVKRSEHADLSDAQFKILAMVTVLQRHFGVKYNMSFSEGEYDGRDAHNLFIHGILSGHGGTCVTMPVLYAAIGRRLGYPIKLVLTKEHMFCRWDEPAERFNIEATSPGMSLPPDEHYLEFPYRISPEEFKKSGYLVSLSPREELGYFLAERGSCLRDNREFARSVEAFHWAANLDARHKGGHALHTLMAQVVQNAFELFHLPPGGPIRQLLEVSLQRFPAGTVGEWVARETKEHLLRIHGLHHKGPEQPATILN